MSRARLYGNHAGTPALRPGIAHPRSNGLSDQPDGIKAIVSTPGLPELLACLFCSWRRWLCRAGVSPTFPLLISVCYDLSPAEKKTFLYFDILFRPPACPLQMCAFFPCMNSPVRADFLSASQTKTRNVLLGTKWKEGEKTTLQPVEDQPQSLDVMGLVWVRRLWDMA